MSIKLRGDFNGLFGSKEGTLLCLSHRETARNENGEDVVLQEGMVVIAFDKDADEHGNPDDLIANGIVIRSPEWLQCYGSKWVLKIDERGVYHESEMTKSKMANRDVSIYSKDHMEVRFAGIVCEESTHTRASTGV